MGPSQQTASLPWVILLVALSQLLLPCTHCSVTCVHARNAAQHVSSRNAGAVPVCRNTTDGDFIIPVIIAVQSPGDLHRDGGYHALRSTVVHTLEVETLEVRSALLCTLGRKYSRFVSAVFLDIR